MLGIVLATLKTSACRVLPSAASRRPDLAKPLSRLTTVPAAITGTKEIYVAVIATTLALVAPVVVPSVPKTLTGKIRRIELREREHAAAAAQTASSAS